MNICIFEDLFIYRLAPVNTLRHTSKIICGESTLYEKITDNIPRKFKVTLHSRKHIAAYCREKFKGTAVNELHDGEYVFLNARVIFSEKKLKEILKHFKKVNNNALVQDGTLIAFHTSEEKTEQYREIINDSDGNLVSNADIDWLGLRKTETSGHGIINNPSDLIFHLEKELKHDLELKMGKKKLHVSTKSKVGKNVVFDTSEGRIYIGKNTEIEPFTYIKGPVYIGDNCVLRSGTGLYGPVRIGNHCKVSGEITSSILHWYVNKQHYGFLGHSYLCEWVNLGAGTTTSNLKNNYSTIELNVEGEIFDTGSIFLGSIVGDHTKTGICTMLNTGTMVGVSSNLYGAGYHKKLVPSFNWADAKTGLRKVYEIEKALNTAKISMNRRKVELTDAYEAMFREAFALKDEPPKL
jgi:UDP-N-acetylglucosamine diphosphorylase / glucose-1-phosphate thymidylyltransferase / UDP-N-acetylgalactosamine diphosphorylase / glucosamine-1-phosphate N-acetyltransferase / galactosamine-1-phosphate N-acetyltransferase